MQYENQVRSLKSQNDELRRVVESHGQDHRTEQLLKENEELRMRITQMQSLGSSTNIEVVNNENSRLIEIYKKKLANLMEEIEQLKTTNEGLRAENHQIKLRNMEKEISLKREPQPNHELMKIELQEERHNNSMLKKQISKLEKAMQGVTINNYQRIEKVIENGEILTPEETEQLIAQTVLFRVEIDRLQEELRTRREAH